MSIALSLTTLISFAPPEPPATLDEPTTEAPAIEPDAGVLEPSAAAPPLEPPPPGGFGSVTTVTTDSNVTAPTPTPTEPEPEDGEDQPGRELSFRAEIGYGQVDLGNRETLDHQGASLRAHLAMFPWVSKSGSVGVGIGLLYGYQGVNRKPLPDSVGFDRSKAQQQLFALSLPLIFRPHPQWFSIQPSGLIGFGFYTGTDLLAANQRSVISRADYAFVAGGDLALCTAWDIVCVVGGSEYLVSLDAHATYPDALGGYPTTRITPWGWHVGLGIDVLRIIDRGNRID